MKKTHGVALSACVLALSVSGCSDSASEASSACELPVRGTAQTAAEVRESTGVAAYRYVISVDRYDIDLLDASDQVVATFSADVDTTASSLEGRSGTGQDRNTIAAGPVAARLETANGETAELSIRTRALHSPTAGVAPIAGETEIFRKKVFTAEQVMQISARGRAVRLLSIYDTQSGLELDRSILVQKDTVATPPTVGREVRMFEPPETLPGAGSLIDYYAIALRTDGEEVYDPEELATFGRQTGIDEALGGEAVRLLLLTHFDPSWGQPVAREIIRCAAGQEELDEADRLIGLSAGVQPKSAASCFSAVPGLLTLLALELGGQAVILGPLAPFILSNPVTVTLAGLVGFGTVAVVTSIAVVECFCQDTRGYVWCDKCEAQKCASYCATTFPPNCQQAAQRIEGQCMDTFELSPGFTATSSEGRCVCTITVRDPESPPPACVRGDPHIDTWDARAFSPQVAGEFVVAEAVAGEPFTLQVRTEPYGGSVCSNVSVVTAVATKLGDASIFIDGPTREVRVDGNLVDLRVGETMSFSDSARLERASEDFFGLYYPGGVEVGVVADGRWMDVAVSVAPGRATEIRGMLGTPDGNPDNELVLRDGTVLDYPLAWDELVTTYVDAWRVAPSESLFFYEAGEDTATFTVMGYPSSQATVDDLPVDVREQAEAVCSDAGVSGAVAFDDCVLDVGCTGIDEIAESHLGRSGERVPISSPAFLSNWSTEGPANPNGWAFFDGSPGGEDDADYNGATTDPAMLVSDQEYGALSLDFELNNTADNSEGVVGVLLSYQGPLSARSDAPNDYDALLLVWSGTAPDAFPSPAAPTGWTLVRLSGVVDAADVAARFYAQQSAPGYEVLATAYGAALGWQNRTGYSASIVYRSDRIEVTTRRTGTEDQMPIAVEAAVLGQSFEPGRIGLLTLGNDTTRFRNVAIAPLE